MLGCFTNTGEITLIQGWDWYAGADPAAIGAGQYDFQTIVTHELGHALGLGHSADAGSAMYATLDTGTVRRTLTPKISGSEAGRVQLSRPCIRRDSLLRMWRDSLTVPGCRTWRLRGQETSFTQIGTGLAPRLANQANAPLDGAFGTNRARDQAMSREAAATASVKCLTAAKAAQITCGRETSSA